MNEQSTAEYVLVTAAYNEAVYIEKVLRSVITQTVLPKKWVIVSDGSTDNTDEIVSRYREKYGFIDLLALTASHERNFGAQVDAINAGIRAIAVGYEYIGNLDADVSFGPGYFERLLMKFEEAPGLGLAGGFIFEQAGGSFKSRRGNRKKSVAHAVQMFRRQCFEAIGGYARLPYGGPDWHAEVSARMLGWQVEAFPELRVDHHRPTGTAGNLVRHWFRQGKMDFSLGCHPVFEILKCVERFRADPPVLGGLARLTGFASSYLAGEPRAVSSDFMHFLRQEQGRRIGIARRRDKSNKTRHFPGVPNSNEK